MRCICSSTDIQPIFDLPSLQVSITNVSLVTDATATKILRDGQCQVSLQGVLLVGIN